MFVVFVFVLNILMIIIQNLRSKTTTQSNADHQFLLHSSLVNLTFPGYRHPYNYLCMTSLLHQFVHMYHGVTIKLHTYASLCCSMRRELCSTWKRCGWKATVARPWCVFCRWVLIQRTALSDSPSQREFVSDDCL